MHINGRNIEFKAIKRVWSFDYFNNQDRKNSAYHPNKKKLLEHIEYLKSRGCYNFSEFSHDWVLYDQDNFIYPFPQENLELYRKRLAEDLKAKGERPE
jgi:hypothetical protein